MTPQELIDLMKTTTSLEHWEQNCNEVKRRCNGYPAFWYRTIVLSGLMDEILGPFGASSKITIQRIGDVL